MTLGYLDELEDHFRLVRPSAVADRLRLTVTGSRDWPPDTGPFILRSLFELIHAHYGRFVRLAHGQARGVDAWADRLGRALDWQIMPYPVSAREWRVNGGYAGHQRNARMLETEQPDLVIAMIHNASRGSTGCRDNALARGIPTLTVDDELALIRRGRATL